MWNLPGEGAMVGSPIRDRRSSFRQGRVPTAGKGLTGWGRGDGVRERQGDPWTLAHSEDTYFAPQAVGVEGSGLRINNAWRLPCFMVYIYTLCLRSQTITPT